MKRRSVWHHIGQGQLLPEHDLEVDLEGNLPTQIPHANRYVSDYFIMLVV